jgi:hypothetical protein
VPRIKTREIVINSGLRPLTIIANFVLGKTGNLSWLHLLSARYKSSGSKKAVADARLYGGIETAQVTAAKRLADPARVTLG